MLIRQKAFDLGMFAPSAVPADTMVKLEAGCRFAVQQPAYTDLAKRLHRGSHYYAPAAAFGKRLAADVVDKKELLQRVGLVK